MRSHSKRDHGNLDRWHSPLILQLRQRAALEGSTLPAAFLQLHLQLRPMQAITLPLNCSRSDATIEVNFIKFDAKLEITISEPSILTQNKSGTNLEPMENEYKGKMPLNLQPPRHPISLWHSYQPRVVGTDTSRSPCQSTVH